MRVSGGLPKLASTNHFQTQSLNDDVSLVLSLSTSLFSYTGKVTAIDADDLILELHRLVRVSPYQSAAAVIIFGLGGSVAAVQSSRYTSQWTTLLFFHTTKKLDKNVVIDKDRSLIQGQPPDKRVVVVTATTIWETLY